MIALLLVALAVAQDEPAEQGDVQPSEGPASSAPEAPADAVAEAPSVAVPEPSVAPEAPRARRTRFAWRGHVKSFALVSLPYPSGLPDDLLHDLLDPLPREPVGQGVLDGRLTLILDHADWLHVEAAHAVTVFLNADSGRDLAGAEVVDALRGDDPLGSLGTLRAVGDRLGEGTAGGGRASPFATGVGVSAPEAFPLTWRAGFDPAWDVAVQGRTDRLLLRFSFPRFHLTVGRQPVGFGSGLFFTPLDLVGPFTPATIDTEYKPGVDAVRFDAYPADASRITVVAAYTGRTYLHEARAPGEPGAARVAAAAWGQTTVGVTDLGLFYGAIQGDHVVGASVLTSAGPVGLHGDAAVTFPRPDLDEPVFFRGVFGVDGRPSPTTTLSGEVYVQTLGAARADDLFEALASERVRRGELWLGGLAYAALAVQQEITPLLVVGATVVANLTDPSALLAPSLSWSISDEVDAVFGGYVGLGRRPEPRPIDLATLPEQPTADDLAVLRPRSEFGTYPATLFAQIRAYF